MPYFLVNQMPEVNVDLGHWCVPDVSDFVSSTSQFISVGLDMLMTLASSSQYSAVIHILSCITPQFLNSPQYLLENET